MSTLLLTRRTTLIAAVAALGAACAGCDGPPPRAFHGMDITGATYGRGFKLTDADGAERTLPSFKGNALLVFFGFTQCPDVCPTALVRAVEIKKLLGDNGRRLQVVFVTVDPERDTPTVLKAYMAAFDPSFVGLYTDLERTADTAKEFKIYYKKVPTGSSYTMDHTALSYVFDPEGRLRLALRHEQPAKDCAEDIQQILQST